MLHLEGLIAAWGVASVGCVVWLLALVVIVVQATRGTHATVAWRRLGQSALMMALAFVAPVLVDFARKSVGIGNGVGDVMCVASSSIAAIAAVVIVWRGRALGGASD